MAADLLDFWEQDNPIHGGGDGWMVRPLLRQMVLIKRWPWCQDHLALMKRVTTRVISEEEVRMSRQWWWSGPWHRVEIYRGVTSCCVVLYWAVWYCILLHGITWYCIVLYYPAWYCTARIIIWYCLVLRCYCMELYKQGDRYIWYCLVLRCIVWYCTSKAIDRGVLNRL